MCIYCGIGYDNCENFYQHLDEKHGLPPPIDTEREKMIPTESCLNGTLKVFTISGSGETDFLQFMTDTKHQIDKLVAENVNQSAQKIQLVAKVELSKPTNGDETSIFVRSQMLPIFGTSIPQDMYLAMVDKMINTLFTFTASGSGWVIDKIVQLDINFAAFNPIRGSSYLPSPPELDASHLLINIRNRQDHNCFLYCFTAAWHLKYGPLLYVASRDTINRRTNPDTYSKRNPMAYQAKGDFNMPMGFHDMLRFEKINNCKINVFRFDKKQLVPLRVSREPDKELEIDLLLVDDGQEYHYVLITDLLRLVNLVKGTGALGTRQLCRNCFHICMNQETYQRHRASCLNHEPAVIIMPKPEKNKLKFTNVAARWFAPVVIYFDLESLLQPVIGCANKAQSTAVTEIHRPSGFCLVGIEHGNPDPIFLQLERSEDCMVKFVDALQRIALQVHTKKQSHRYYTIYILKDQRPLKFVGFVRGNLE